MSLPADLAALLHAGPLDRRHVRALHLAPDVLTALRQDVPTSPPPQPWDTAALAQRLATSVDVYLDENLPPGGWRLEIPEQWNARVHGIEHP